MKYNVDRATAFKVISILESIRIMQAAKKPNNMERRTAKALERRHQERNRHAVGPKEPEFVKVKTYCISVSKTADLVQVLPDVIAKELKSMNIYF